MSNKVEIIISAKNMAGAALSGVSGNVKSMASASISQVQKLASSIKKTLGGAVSWIGKQLTSLKALAGAALAGWGLKKLSSELIDAASTSEDYRLRLNALLGDVREGSKLFAEMTAYASKVPFQYREIMGAATALSGVMSGGVDEIKRWIPLIGDLAAASGLGFEETTSQVIRMYSAGAASADLFRERGILAMLGFTAGVSYSVEDTRRMMFEAWDSTGSKFKGLTEQMGGTWKGIMSMFGDMWFAFRNMVADAGLWEYMKNGAQSLLDKITELKDNGTLAEWAQKISDSMIAASKWVSDMALRIYNEFIPALKEAWLWAEWYWAQMMEFLNSSAPAEIWQNIKDIFSQLPVFLKSAVGFMGLILDIVKPLWDLSGVIEQIILKTGAALKSWFVEIDRFAKKSAWEKIQVVIDFLGFGSTERPLSEKIDEMTDKMGGFSDYIDGLKPTLSVGFNTPANRISASGLYAGDRDLLHDQFGDIDLYEKRKRDVETYQPPVAEFARGTGPAGLPYTGMFYGHAGEIVKSPAESAAERAAASASSASRSLIEQIRGIPVFQPEEGPSGLPYTGNIYKHAGEIIKQPCAAQPVTAAKPAGSPGGSTKSISFGDIHIHVPANAAPQRADDWRTITRIYIIPELQAAKY